MLLLCYFRTNYEAIRVILDGYGEGERKFLLLRNTTTSNMCWYFEYAMFLYLTILPRGRDHLYYVLFRTELYIISFMSKVYLAILRSALMNTNGLCYFGYEALRQYVPGGERFVLPVQQSHEFYHSLVFA